MRVFRVWSDVSRVTHHWLMSRTLRASKSKAQMASRLVCSEFVAASMLEFARIVQDIERIIDACFSVQQPTVLAENSCVGLHVPLLHSPISASSISTSFGSLGSCAS
jgi:hypothetical protein